MKILEICFTLGPGGLQRFLVDLCNEVCPIHDVTVLTIKDDTEDAEFRNFCRPDLDPRIKYINLKHRKGETFSAIWRMYKTINKVNPDIVHMNGAGMPSFCSFANLMLHKKCKFYYTIHSDLHNGYSNGFNKIYFNTFGRLGLIRLACLSPKNYDDFQKFYPHVKKKCIPNGRAKMIPSNAYETVGNEIASYRSNKDSLLFIHVSRLDPVKNHTLLISTFNKLVSSGHNADLIIIGARYDTEDGLKLQKSACERVHFIGTKTNVPDYMLQSDVFALSSDYEGLPITLIEATLAGLPCVSTPVCGAVDIIEDGVTGKLSKDHDPESYYDAMKFVYDNYDALKANSFMRKDISPYTMENCAKQYIEYFNQK